MPDGVRADDPRPTPNRRSRPAEAPAPSPRPPQPGAVERRHHAGRPDRAGRRPLRRGRPVAGGAGVDQLEAARRRRSPAPAAARDHDDLPPGGIRIFGGAGSGTFAMVARRAGGASTCAATGPGPPHGPAGRCDVDAVAAGVGQRDIRTAEHRRPTAPSRATTPIRVLTEPVTLRGQPVFSRSSATAPPRSRRCGRSSSCSSSAASSRSRRRRASARSTRTARSCRSGARSSPSARPCAASASSRPTPRTSCGRR